MGAGNPNTRLWHRVGTCRFLRLRLAEDEIEGEGGYHKLDSEIVWSADGLVWQSSGVREKRRRIELHVGRIVAVGRQHQLGS